MGIQKVLTGLAGLRSSVDVLSANGGQCCKTSTGGCSNRFMTQWIDHSNHSIGTFQQEVQVITKYFKPGGPILLFQGAETTEIICVETTSVHDFARELGGIAASIEHRYFGQSIPLGPDKANTPDGLKYLTLDNVMGDTIKFIEEIRVNVTGADKSHVIVAGGSYGGLVTTALRLNRPEHIYGAIASSPPLRSFLTANGNVPGRFDTWNWISNVISERSAAAAFAIRNAFNTLERALESGNPNLQANLNLCRAPNGPEEEWGLLIRLIAPFQLMTQFNNAQPSRSFFPTGYPLDLLIDTVLSNSKDSFQLLRSVTSLWYKNLNPSWSCLDVEPHDPVNPGYGIQGYPYMYIYCTYQPICIGSISNETIFIGRDLPPSEDFSFCKPTYGVTPMTDEQLKARYHLSQEDYERSERLLISVGQYDPITVLAPPYLPRSANIHKSKLLYVSNMAHTEDLNNGSPGDKPEVTQARAIELETIKGWLGAR